VGEGGKTIPEKQIRKLTPTLSPPRKEKGDRRLRAGAIGSISETSSSLRLAAQDVALSRRKQGFESPRERQSMWLNRAGTGA
jgi:hypothetical protein